MIAGRISLAFIAHGGELYGALPPPAGVGMLCHYHMPLAAAGTPVRMPGPRLTP
jgi:hypothetical protein